VFPEPAFVPVSAIILTTVSIESEDSSRSWAEKAESVEVNRQW